mmetsp:Transcript_26379/g.48201  ORF Transcript_26379/g.48201 Transcript_26379/m.48201 type:complete len:256 (-) Transcript_26379:1700-2467(-)
MVCGPARLIHKLATQLESKSLREGLHLWVEGPSVLVVQPLSRLNRAARDSQQFCTQLAGDTTRVKVTRLALVDYSCDRWFLSITACLIDLRWLRCNLLLLWHCRGNSTSICMARLTLVYHCRDTTLFCCMRLCCHCHRLLWRRWAQCYSRLRPCFCTLRCVGIGVRTACSASNLWHSCYSGRRLGVCAIASWVARATCWRSNRRDFTPSVCYLGTWALCCGCHWWRSWIVCGAGGHRHNRCWRPHRCYNVLLNNW